MALSPATALALVRSQANIPASNTSFDSDIATYITQAVQMLWPVAGADIDADTTKTVNADNRTITLPSGTLDVERLELYSSDDSDYYPTNEFTVHNRKTIRLDSYVASGTACRIWGRGYYTITTVPPELEWVVIYWALSLLYASFAGNKRKYNIYVGAAGAAGDRDMKDSAQFFRSAGNDLLVDRVGIQGA